MPSSGLVPINTCPFCAEDPRTGCSAPGGVSPGWRIPSLDLLTMLVLMQPRMRLALWAGSAHTSWSMSSFSSARPPWPSPQGSANDFFSQSIPLSGSAMTRMQHLALGLAELHEALIDPFFKFSSGWKTSLASCPSVVLTALLNFRSSANFLKVLLPRQNLEGCHL